MSSAHEICVRAPNKWITADQSRTSISYFIISFRLSAEGIRAVAAYTHTITATVSTARPDRRKKNRRNTGILSYSELLSIETPNAPIHYECRRDTRKRLMLKRTYHEKNIARKKKFANVA